MDTSQQPLTSNLTDNDNNVQVHGYYKKRQCGCFWILLLLAGIGQVAGFISYLAFIVSGDLCSYYDTDSDTNNIIDCEPFDSDTGSYNIVYGILFICWGLSTIWTQIEDRGDYLQITYGPCRWLLCGMGKEKIRYRDIHHVSVSRSCFYGFGIPCCTSIKLFNTCSCCCGDGAECCRHQTIKLTIKERPQGEGATDEDNCFCEQCCLQCCCGDRGEYLGKGACFECCCNPCDANFCIMNTVFVSTNDADGVLQLLNDKRQNRNDGDAATYAYL